MKVEHNISRLYYLLDIFGISIKRLIELLNEQSKAKTPITEEDVNSAEIKVSLLKKIDKIFNKGLHFYLDPKAPEKSKDASIFFRKEKFNSELNLGARKVVSQFEEFKISLSAIAKLAELNLERRIPVYLLSHNPLIVANELREILYPEFDSDLRSFLKALISKLADHNIMVFEFVETWNKKDKANIDGFFLDPNVIVLKRQQRSFRREIFTLAHELGHFLLQEEEVESLDYQTLANKDVNRIEKWCNDFAYYFLVGSHRVRLEGLPIASSENDYHYELIEDISKRTHLSKLALYTRLLFLNKVSPANYSIIKSDEEEKYKKALEEEKKQRELEKAQGKKQGGSTPKPIKSPLLISTIQNAYYGGVISEYEVAKRLNIQPDKVAEYIQ